jgi:glycosyltransferase involved in cell wall biosynthesis
MNIVFFQFGDFGEAWRRFDAGEDEGYRDQKLSVAFVASLADRHRVTTVAICDRPHREQLAGNLWSIGVDPATAYSPTRLLPIMAGLDPTILVCRTPHLALPLWARLRKVPTLPLFADIFSRGGLKTRLKTPIWRFAMSGSNVPCVANHSLNASLSIPTVLHIPQTRVVPWEQLPLDVNPEAKPAFANSTHLRAFFTGAMSVQKGVGDCLSAAALLRDQGIRLEIDFAGSNETAFWQTEADRLGIADRVGFLGRLANTEVRLRMREADIVLVPSHHDYAEGLPNTLCEALAARSVAAVSDHPAFANRLRPDEDCLMFRAADPQDMADQIARLAADPALQVRLSCNAAAAHDQLYIGIEWSRLVGLFVEDPRDKTAWVQRHSLQALRNKDQKLGLETGSLAEIRAAGSETR